MPTRDSRKAAARRRPSNWAAPIRARPAVCPILCPPIRRCSRWSPTPGKPGLRGKPEIPFFHNLSWNVGAFRDENHNDILFIAAPKSAPDISRTSPRRCAKDSMRIWMDASGRSRGAGLDLPFGHLSERRDAGRLGKQHQQLRTPGISGTGWQSSRSIREIEFR